MATEWTQFGLRLGALLLAPVVAMVLLNPRARPAADGSGDPQPPPPAEEITGAVLPGAEATFWARYSSGSGSMRFESPPNVYRDDEDPRAVSDPPPVARTRVSALEAPILNEEAFPDRPLKAEGDRGRRHFGHRLHAHHQAHRSHPTERKHFARRT